MLPPDNTEMKFRRAVSPVKAVRSDENLPVLTAIFARDGNRREPVLRLAADPATINRIVIIGG